MMAKQEHWISAAGCVYDIYYHFVWCTKYRRPVLVGGGRRVESFTKREEAQDHAERASRESGSCPSLHNCASQVVALTT